MAKEKHAHKFHRHKYSTSRIIFFCVLPDCSFKSNPALLLGKRSICNICEEEFILTEYSLRLAKPHCEKCHKPKDKIYYKNPEKIITEANKIPLAERLQKVINSTVLPDESEEDEI